ncbi:MAG: hypothetical protein AABZ60_23490 [Planctomycetota bacterium]
MALNPVDPPQTVPPRPHKGWTRRRFFKNLGKVVLGGGVLTTIRVTGYADPPPDYTLQVFTDTDYAIMEQIVYTIIEQEPNAPDPRTLKSVQAIDQYLYGFPASIHWQIRLLLRLIEHTPFLFHGYLRRFTNLSKAAKKNVLQGWDNSYFAVKRQGFKALKTMAYLSYYRHPDSWSALNYEGPLIPRGYPDGEKETPYAQLLAPKNTIPTEWQ